MLTRLYFFFIIMTCLSLTSFSQSNYFQLGIGIAGSDGTSEEIIYEISYKRKLSKLFSITALHSHMSGDEDVSPFFNSEIYQGTRYLGPDNTSEYPVVGRRISSSIFLGAEINAVRTYSSMLYFIIGGRYESISKSQIISRGSNADFLEVGQFRENQIGLELGIGYQRQFTKRHFVGGKFTAGPSTSFFGVILTAGVTF